jgi:hypothetical protein
MFPAHMASPKLAGSVEGGTPLAGAVSVMEFIRWCKAEVFMILESFAIGGKKVDCWTLALLFFAYEPTSV